MHKPDVFLCRTTSVMLALALTAISLNAAAFGSLNDLQPDATEAEFKALDKNHDGYLTHDETAHEADLSSRFNTADRNHDGKLSADEFANGKSEAQQAHMKSFLEDSTITAKVKADLLKDNGIRGLAISVETHRGQVILSGFVDNEQQVRRASEIASGVRGVLSVKNSLLLKG